MGRATSKGNDAKSKMKHPSDITRLRFESSCRKNHWFWGRIRLAPVFVGYFNKQSPLGHITLDYSRFCSSVYIWILEGYLWINVTYKNRYVYRGSLILFNVLVFEAFGLWPLQVVRSSGCEIFGLWDLRVVRSSGRAFPGCVIYTL